VSPGAALHLPSCNASWLSLRPGSLGCDRCLMNLNTLDRVAEQPPGSTQGRPGRLGTAGACSSGAWIPPERYLGSGSALRACATTEDVTEDRFPSLIRVDFGAPSAASVNSRRTSPPRLRRRGQGWCWRAAGGQGWGGWFAPDRDTFLVSVGLLTAFWGDGIRGS
jgi:hypothetical protein